MRTPSLPANAALQDVAYGAACGPLAHATGLPLMDDELRAITNSSENRESSVIFS